MTTHPSLYTHIPATDRLLREPQVQSALSQYGHTATVEVLRQLQHEARRHIQAENALPDWCAAWGQEVERRLNDNAQSALRPVLNLTGTVLHTNLGRAQQAEEAVTAVVQAMRSPVTLEYDLDLGRHQVGKGGNLQNTIIGEVRFPNSSERNGAKKRNFDAFFLWVYRGDKHNPCIALVLKRLSLPHERKSRLDGLPIKRLF